MAPGQVLVIPHPMAAPYSDPLKEALQVGRGRGDRQGSGPQQESLTRSAPVEVRQSQCSVVAVTLCPTHCPSVPFSLGSAARVLGSGQTEVGSQD